MVQTRYIKIIKDSGITKSGELSKHLYGDKLGKIFKLAEEFGDCYIAETVSDFFRVEKEDALIMSEEAVFHSGSPKKQENYYEVWPGLEALDVIASLLEKEEFIGFLKGNILKYQLRKGNKPGEPLEKDQEKLNTYKQILREIL